MGIKYGGHDLCIQGTRRNRWNGTRTSANYRKSRPHDSDGVVLRGRTSIPFFVFDRWSDPWSSHERELVTLSTAKQAAIRSTGFSEMLSNLNKTSNPTVKFS
jgi:hypothetical protein